LRKLLHLRVRQTGGAHNVNSPYYDRGPYQPAQGHSGNGGNGGATGSATANALDAFDGENASGDWVFGICDNWGGDTAHIRRVKLFFDGTPTLALIDNFRVDLVNTRGRESRRVTPDYVNLFSALKNENKDVEIAVVRWETVQEHGTVGFYIERQAAEGQWQKLNGGAMLQGLVSSPLGGEYAFVDSEVRRGETYSYRLVEEDIWNGHHIYGPWTVLIGAVDHSVNPPLDQSAVKHQFGQKPVPDTSTDPAQKTFFKEWQSLASGFSGRSRDVKPPVVRKVNNNSFVSFLAFKKVAGAKKIRINRVRLKTRDATMYQVTVDELASVTGQGAAKISRKLLSGHWDFSTEDGGAAYYFDQESQTLYFAADKHQTIETLDNVYRLGKFRRKKGWKMDSVIGSGPDNGEIGQFRDTLYFAEKNYLLTWIHSDEEADYGYWKYVYASPTSSVDLLVNLPDPAINSTQQGIIKVVLRGASNKVADGNDHLARVSVNGNLLSGEVRWDGMQQAILELPFNQTLLGGAESGEIVSVTVGITGEALNGAAYSLFYIESVEISYDRKMYAQKRCAATS